MVKDYNRWALFYIESDNKYVLFGASMRGLTQLKAYASSGDNPWCLDLIPADVTLSDFLAAISPGREILVADQTMLNQTIEELTGNG